MEETKASSEAARPITPPYRQPSQWLSRIAVGVILAVAFLVPIVHLPFTIDVLFIKVTLIELAAVMVFAAWLLHVFAERRISYKRSLVNAALAALAVIIAISTFLSPDRAGSLFGPDPTGETTAALYALIVLSFVLAAVFSEADLKRLSVALLASFLLLALAVLVSILGARVFTVPAFLQVNPIGTVNALAIVLAAGFVFSAGLAFTHITREGDPATYKYLNIVSWVVALATFAALLVLNFRIAWLGIAATVAVYLALHLARASAVVRGRSSLAAAFAVLVVSLFLVLSRPNLAGRLFQPPLEISPSFRATVSIATRVLQQGKVFGSGPATFLIDYNRYRDRSLNLTNFWAIRFAHGFSFVGTVASTLGIAGFLAVLGLAVVTVGSYFRSLWIRAEISPLALSSFGGMLILFLFWFTYASNLVSNFLLFLFVGMLGALSQEPRRAEGSTGAAGNGGTVPGAAVGPWWRRFHWPSPARLTDGSRSRWRITRRTIEIADPTLHFIVSLFVVFLSAFSLIASYFLVTQYVAEGAYGRGVRVLNASGSITEAEAHINRARVLNPSEDRYDRALAELALVRLQGIIQQAAAQPSQELQSQFRDTLSSGVAAAERASARNPHEPSNWFLLGQLFEAVTPFLVGADQASLTAYDRARDADPLNPALAFAQGRVYLTVSDLLQLQAAQAKGQDQKRLLEARVEALGRAKAALDLSLDLKPDYASSHFLLAQVAIRENKLAEAIRKTEETARLAPADIGVAFQLGFLYYRADNLERAKAEFERAILLNDNYSNARYFLGLIYDRRGDRDASLSQFQKIAALNPGNEEVERIIQNLKAGRRALSGIVPPAPAPEARSEAPVKEKGEEKRPIRRR